MAFPPDLVSELSLLALFDGSSSQEGLKVHQQSADPTLVAAAQRLHQKGLITHADGGYLTSLGAEAAEHFQRVVAVLTSDPAH